MQEKRLDLRVGALENNRYHRLTVRPVETDARNGSAQIPEHPALVTIDLDSIEGDGQPLGHGGPNIPRTGPGGIDDQAAEAGVLAETDVEKRCRGRRPGIGCQKAEIHDDN